MRIEALTTTSGLLVTATDKAMNDGALKTWKIVKDKNGNVFYTHTPEQWNEKALIAREAKADRVVFTIRHWSTSPEPSKEIEGYYIGRFTEILLVHFSKSFSKLESFS
jgi:hypothetical protein